MLLQVALGLGDVELIHRERPLRRRLLEHLARLGAQRPSNHLVHQGLDVLASAVRGVVDGKEVVVLIDGDYSRSFDLEVFGIAFTLEFAPEMLDMNFSLA